MPPTIHNLREHYAFFGGLAFTDRYSSHFSKSEIAARRRTLRAAESEFLDTIGNLSGTGLVFPLFPIWVHHCHHHRRMAG